MFNAVAAAVRSVRLQNVGSREIPARGIVRQRVRRPIPPSAGWNAGSFHA